MGDGVRTISLDRFVDENIAPTYTACGQSDQYGCWNWWGDVQNAYAESGAEYIALSSFDRGHEFPYGIDTIYKHDRYETFVDFLMYHAKKDIPVSIFYTSAVDGKLVKAGPTGEILEGDELIIQFVAEVKEEDLKIRLYDESAKKELDFTLKSSCGGTRWQVVAPFTKGNRYTLTVLGETKGELNGIAMGQDKEYLFTY
jgi:capsid portal protein